MRSLVRVSTTVLGGLPIGKFKHADYLYRLCTKVSFPENYPAYYYPHARRRYIGK